MNKHKKSKPYLSTNEAVIVVVLIVILILMISTQVFTGAKHDNVNSQDVIAVNKYKQLLQRAHELTTKYKSLTGSDTLPTDLTLNTVQSEIEAVVKPKTKDSIVVGIGKVVSELTKSNTVNVVLGMAQDTDSKNLAVFCKSLRKVSTADVILFVNSPVPARHKSIAAESRITLIEFDLDDMELSMKKFHPSTLRWTLFHSYLSDNKALQDKYQRVWMIDVRDSYFQEDPFGFLEAAERSGTPDVGVFHAFQGVESTTISACGWNGGWVKDCFGQDMLNRMGHNHIICSGVSATTSMASAMAYITLMNNVITSQPNPALTYSGKFPTCERNGVDQGVHNVLIHMDALALSTKNDRVRTQVKIWSQKDSPVANMQARVATLRSNNQEVFNSAGSKVAVVHQYDRYPELQKYLFSQFVDWVNANDFVSVWADEPTCNKFNYKENADLFRGKCDLKMHGGATSAASCCQFCTNLANCQAFTFAGGVCYLKSCKDGVSGRTEMQGAVSGYLK